MLICCVFIRQAIGSFVSPGRKGCFSTITLDIINDKPDWSWLSSTPLRMFFRRVFERSKYCCHIFPCPQIFWYRKCRYLKMETFLTRKIEYQKSNYMAGTTMKSISRKKVPIVQLSNGWKWQSQGLKGRTARKGWKSSCRSCQRRAANLTQKLKHIWEPIMKEAQQKAFTLCLRVKRARNRNFNQYLPKIDNHKMTFQGRNFGKCNV